MIGGAAETIIDTAEEFNGSFKIHFKSDTTDLIVYKFVASAWSEIGRINYVNASYPFNFLRGGTVTDTFITRINDIIISDEDSTDETPVFLTAYTLLFRDTFNNDGVPNNLKWRKTNPNTAGVLISNVGGRLNLEHFSDTSASNPRMNNVATLESFPTDSVVLSFDIQKVDTNDTTWVIALADSYFDLGVPANRALFANSSGISGQIGGMTVTNGTASPVTSFPLDITTVKTLRLDSTGGTYDFEVWNSGTTSWDSLLSLPNTHTNPMNLSLYQGSLVGTTGTLIVDNVTIVDSPYLTQRP